MILWIIKDQRLNINGKKITLTEEDLEKIHQNIIQKTSQKFNAKLRSYWKFLILEIFQL